MILPDFDAARERFLSLRDIHRPFYDHVAERHQAHAEVNRGHGLEHDAQVALNCLAFAPDQNIGNMAWIAAFCHSMDYWERDDREAWQAFVVEALDKISVEMLPVGERQIIMEAVMRHHMMNQDDDHIVQQVLQDADRIGNLFVSTAFRIGRGYLPDLPIIDPRDLDADPAGSNYNDPWSCFNDFWNCLHDYVPQFRTKGARALCSKVLEPTLNQFFAAMRQQHGQFGILGLDL